MVFSVISASISQILFTFSQSVLVVSLLLTIAFAMGWMHRLVWYLAESEISKALNGTPVTIGNLHFDLLRGQLWCSNLVLHAPRRDQFHWDSPLLARVGRLYVQGNFVQCLFSHLILREELPFDLYTLAASDIQVFIERRHNVLNFFLCDKHVVIPDMGEDIEDNSHDHEDSTNEEESTSMNETITDPTNPEEKAQMLMDDMLRAIRQAAKEGSIKGALVEHRQKLTDQLKALQVTKKSVAMKEGAEIVQHVSEAVRKKTQTVQKVVQPTRKESIHQKNKEKTDLIRMARIQIKDVRIFTHEHWDRRKKSTWSKPLVIPKVDVRSSELCPPLSAKDEHDLPALYQPVDQCLEVLWRRLLTEGAKTNSGNLFKTAMGEILDYWTENHVEDLKME